MANIATITDAFSVAPQLQASEFGEVAALGFKSIVNLRPDGEVAECLTDAEASNLARSSDLAYRHIPVPIGGVTPDQVADFGDLLSTLPTPILAYCGSGRRAAILWALVSAKTADAGYILHCCERAGHDLAALGPTLEELAVAPRPR